MLLGRTLKSSWSWKEGFRFALAGELLSEAGVAPTYKLNIAEKFGSHILKPAYKMIAVASKHIRQPLAICLFTILAALFIALVFYNIPAFAILGNFSPVRQSVFYSSSMLS